jgi:hypothetical protein
VDDIANVNGVADYLGSIPEYKRHQYGLRYAGGLLCGICTERADCRAAI